MWGVRTTVNIHESILKQLKHESARSGRTIGAIIEDAVRVLFRDSEEPRADLEPLVTAGGSGVMPGIDIADMGSVQDALDEGESLDALR